MFHRLTGAAFAVAVLLAAGCASEVTRQTIEAPASAPEAGKRFTLSQPASFRLDSGYSRTVAANTEFAGVGRIGQGLVFRPVDTVLTVEGKHMHEAYAVVRDGTLVGFYLPVEKAFSPLSQTTPFLLIERKQ
jgi:hypothetical protein